MPKHFNVFVPYTQPTSEELHAAFNSVTIESGEIINRYNKSGYYLGTQVVHTAMRFIALDQYKEVSRIPRHITFTYLTVRKDTSTTEAIEMMVAKGLRPGLYEELVAFAGTYPNEQFEREIVALGSRNDGVWWIYAVLGGINHANYINRSIHYSHFSGEVMKGSFGQRLRAGTRCLVTKIGN